MPDLTWWVTVLGGLASITVVLGAVVTFWSESARGWFKRQFDIDEVRHNVNRLGSSVDKNTEELQEIHEELRYLSDDHKRLGILAVDAYTSYNELVEKIAKELEIPEEDLPGLNAEGAREDLFGDEPSAGDYTRGGD